MNHAHSLRRLFLAALLLGPASGARAVLINELRIDQPGPDRDEYVELAGRPGESLDGLSYLVIGDGRVGGSGVIESVTPLDGQSIGAGGLFLVAERSFSLGATPDLVTRLDFENGDNVTHLLVRGLTADRGDDLDGDDDGRLDFIPWLALIDGLALIETAGAGDLVYSATRLDAGTGQVPAHAYRQGRGWQVGSYAIGTDTPGRANPAIAVPAPGGLALLIAGLLGMSHHRRTRCH